LLPPQYPPYSRLPHRVAFSSPALADHEIRLSKSTSQAAHFQRERSRPIRTVCFARTKSNVWLQNPPRETRDIHAFDHSPYPRVYTPRRYQNSSDFAPRDPVHPELVLPGRPLTLYGTRDSDPFDFEPSRISNGFEAVQHRLKGASAVQRRIMKSALHC